jgi:hypothetical protein
MNPAPFTPPDGFFAQQRADVLRATREPHRLAYGVAAGLVLLITGSWWAVRGDEPCATYACLLEATPLEELPVEWAEYELLETGQWPDDLMESLDELSM